MSSFTGPTMTCRDCGYVVEVRYEDAPYLSTDDPRLCEHMTGDAPRRIEGLRLGDSRPPGCLAFWDPAYDEYTADEDDE